MTGALQQFLQRSNQLERFARYRPVTAEELWVETLVASEEGPFIGGMIIHYDDICPRCGGSFEATGGKPANGDPICQKCCAERRPMPMSGVADAWL